MIYIPPKFGHEGVSLEPSLTYSVGFLGPSLSEMLNEFGHYLEEHHENLPRYLGQNLTKDAVPFQIGTQQIADFKSFMTDVFEEDYFNNWLTQYFSRPTHTDEEETLPDIELPDQGELLVKPPEVKILLAPLKSANKYSVSVGDCSFELDQEDLPLVSAMASEEPFKAEIFEGHPEILNTLLQQHKLDVI